MNEHNRVAAGATADTTELMSPPTAARELARLWGRPSLSVDSVYLYMRDKGLKAIDLPTQSRRRRYGITRQELERFARAYPKLHPGKPRRGS
jgi:hypothetical protein